MNKNLLSLGAVIALLGAMPATAKMPTTLNSKPQRLHAGATPAEALKFVKAHTVQLLEQQKAGGLKTAKTTAMESRLIATAYRESDGTTLSLTDSSKIKYSWGRGGDLKSTIIKFDTAFNYTNGGTSSPLQLDNRSYATYDANNNQLTNYNQVYNYSTSTYDQNERTLNTYNTANLMVNTETQFWNGTAWEGSYMDKYTYNSAGKQMTDTSFEWNSSSYDYYTLTVTSYTSTGKESKMMLYVYIGTWIPYVSVDYTYNVDDNIADVAVKINMSGTGLEDYERVTFTYDVAKNPITQDIEIWDGASWSNYIRVASTFDASANVLSEVTLYWDGTSAYDSSNRTDYTYNTNNQETSETTYTYDGSSWIMDSGDSRTNYYYEDFSPTAVKEAATVTANVNLYPVPAGDELSLQIAQTAAQSIDMQIVDMQGRSVITRHYASAKNISDKISVSNLTSGTYFLKLSDGTVRNFTVAH